MDRDKPIVIDAADARKMLADSLGIRVDELQPVVPPPKPKGVFGRGLKDEVEWSDVLNACFAWGRVYGVTLEDGETNHITEPREA